VIELLRIKRMFVIRLKWITHVFAINLAETDTQFPGVRQHDIAMLVNLSFTLTLCNYSSRYFRHLNFICIEREKKKKQSCRVGFSQDPARQSPLGEFHKPGQWRHRGYIYCTISS